MKASASISLHPVRRALVRSLCFPSPLGHSRCIVLILLFCGVTPATADVLYSINRTTDELVTVDTSTAAISVVGPIGFDMNATRLTLHNGLLYGLTGNAGDFDQTAFTLVGINPVTGQMVSSTNVTFNTQNLRFAEGLASVGGHLVVGFRDPSQGTVSQSPLLGELSLSGTITAADNFLPLNADFDALAADDLGQLVSVDGVIDQQKFVTYAVTRSPAPLAYSMLHSYSGGTVVAPFNAHDLAFTAAGLFVLNTERSEIHLVDPNSNTVIQSVAYLNSVVLTGLEAVPVPEPAAVILAASGILAIASSLLLRHRKRRGQTVP